MTFQTLLVERAGTMVTVILNRPDARNAIDMVMRRELIEAFDEIEADTDVRVVILTGANEHFCSGGDMRSLRDRKPTAAEHLERVRALNRLIIRLVNFPRPTIAMVDGFAVGSGCNLALSCDLVVASDRARFGQVFAKVGLVPDGGSSWVLPRLIGLVRAKELIFTSDILSAEDALRMGLVNKVASVATLASTTRALAERIALGPPAALLLAKRLLNDAMSYDLATALEAEALAQAEAVMGQEHQEGVAALFEKRSPRF